MHSDMRYPTIKILPLSTLHTDPDCLPPIAIPTLLSHTSPCHPQRPFPCLLPAHTRGGSVCGRGGVCCRFWRWASVGWAHAHPNQPWPSPTVTLSYSLTTNARSVLRLATSSVRPKKSKSIYMRLDWMKERAGQRFFRLIFLPGLINPADFFTKILPVYRHIAALPFLHGARLQVFQFFLSSCFLPDLSFGP